MKDAFIQTALATDKVRRVDILSEDGIVKSIRSGAAHGGVVHEGHARDTTITETAGSSLCGASVFVARNGVGDGGACHG